MKRTDLAELIATRLLEEKDTLSKMWASEGPIRRCFVDDVLPPGIADRVPDAFPDPGDLMLHSTIRERKRFGVDLGRYDPLIGELLYPFQQPAVIDATAGGRSPTRPTTTRSPSCSTTAAGGRASSATLRPGLSGPATASGCSCNPADSAASATR